MRGEAERNCFELVQKNLDYENFFAMSYKDRDLIKYIFEKAKPNENLNAFPDFIFDSGFIEHFQVTSSTEGRKGSLMEREKAGIHQDFNERVKEVSKNFSEDGITIQSVSTTQYWHQSHSYENFVQSFKSNLGHHIKNMEKYTGKKDLKVFMVEYSDSALRMNKVYPKDLMKEVSYGDLMKREPPTYRLSRDIDLLKYLYDERNYIDFIIFVNNNCFYKVDVDIVKVSNALEITKLLYEGYVFYSTMVGTAEFGMGVSYPNFKGDL